MNPPRHDRQQRGGQRRRTNDSPPRRPSESSDSEMEALCRKVLLVPPQGEPLAPELFDDIAEKVARKVARDNTKTSQLRRFYDELLRWDDRVNRGDPEGAKDRLREHLPFIRMMNAKAAYAKGRKLVGQSFVALLRRCLEQVSDDPAALRNCRLFFEAFMGFYKLHGPRD